jgi:RimJ/RimL family protein N-acetyltransferase
VGRAAIGIADAALLGQGLGSEAIQLAVAHAFGPMGLHRLSLRVLAFNGRAIRAYQKCGFRVEGRERESALIDDVWHDDLIMGLLAEDDRPGQA